LITAKVEADLVDVRIQDSGRWRTSSRDGGLGKGLHVMRALMDEVHIESSEQGTLMRMRRKTAR
jgi:anti-sigma regulatory factor (Ser/Thr protein kinase)